MVTLQDALFNWLQIKIVSDARPEDLAAKETLDFFDQILREDHQVTDVLVIRSEEDMDPWVQVQYEIEGQQQTKKFEREAADQLLADINTNPKYNA